MKGWWKGDGDGSGFFPFDEQARKGSAIAGRYR